MAVTVEDKLMASQHLAKLIPSLGHRFRKHQNRY